MIRSSWRGSPRAFFLHLLVAGTAFVLAPRAGAVEPPPHRAVPGGVAVVELGASDERPQVSLDAVPVLVVGDARRWTAIVGIPLSAEPGTRHVLVRRDGAPEHHRDLH